MIATSFRRVPVGTLALAAALLAAAIALGVVAARGPGEPRTLQDRMRSVASTLRCPICQDLSVADSPSGLAQQMRATITQDLQAGMSPDQIRAGFVAAYGQWILLSPTKRGLNLLAWVVPILLFLGGAGAAALAVRNWSTSGETPPSHRIPAEQRDGVVPVDQLSSGDRTLLERALRTVESEVE